MYNYNIVNINYLTRKPLCCISTDVYRMNVLFEIAIAITNAINKNLWKV